MHLPLAYSLPRNPTVKVSISVLTAYYVRVSDAVVVSVFVTTETELVLIPLPLKLRSDCRRCVAMDGRSNSDIRLSCRTPQY
jgi:hypothetical protein